MPCKTVFSATFAPLRDAFCHGKSSRRGAEHAKERAARIAGMETTVPARVVEINYTLPLILLGLFMLALIAGLLVLVVVRGRRGKSAE